MKKMLNVLPCFSVDNIVHAAPLEFEFCRQVQNFLARLVGFANVFYISFIHFMARVILALYVSTSMSSFFYHIGCICFSSSKEQVIWPNAGRVVAFMTNQLSFWNFSKVNFPRSTMRFYFPVTVCANRAIGIRWWHCASNPKPAALSFVNQIPKSIYKWNFHAFLTAIFCLIPATGAERHEL